MTSWPWRKPWRANWLASLSILHDRTKCLQVPLKAIWCSLRWHEGVLEGGKHTGTLLHATALWWWCCKTSRQACWACNRRCLHAIVFWWCDCCWEALATRCIIGALEACAVVTVGGPRCCLHVGRLREGGTLTVAPCGSAGWVNRHAEAASHVVWGTHVKWRVHPHRVQFSQPWCAWRRHGSNWRTGVRWKCFMR